MQTISVSDLSSQELLKVSNTIQERFLQFDNENVVEIAFGAKQSADTALKGQLAVCFFVKRKRSPKKARDAIEPTVSVRLKRGGRYVQVVLPTDVIESKDPQPTGAAIYDPRTRKRLAVTGLPVRLSRQTGNSQRWNAWGMVTVGHPFQSVTLPFQVRMAPRLRGRQRVTGMVQRRASVPESDFDACFVQADRQSLANAGYLQPTGLQLMMSDQELIAAANRQQLAKVLRTDGQVTVRMTHYVVRTMRPLPRFGYMRGVIRGTAPRAKLKVGTSGAIWRINNRIAGLQFGAIRPEFKIAYSQSVSAIVNEWLRVEFRAQARILNGF